MNVIKCRNGDKNRKRNDFIIEKYEILRFRFDFIFFVSFHNMRKKNDKQIHIHISSISNKQTENNLNVQIHNIDFIYEK